MISNDIFQKKLSSLSPLAKRDRCSELKPNSKKEPSPVKTQRVQNIDWTRYRPSRAGIIVYYRNPTTQQLHFCMGIDRQYGDMSDFGGGVIYRKDGTALSGALREFDEESLKVFGSFTPQDLSSCLAVYNNDLVIIFVPIKTYLENINVKFQQQVNQEQDSSNDKLHIKEPEMSSLVWLTQEQFHKAIHSSSQPALYSRVKNLLKSAGNFFRLL